MMNTEPRKATQITRIIPNIPYWGHPLKLLGPSRSTIVLRGLRRVLISVPIMPWDVSGCIIPSVDIMNIMITYWWGALRVNVIFLWELERCFRWRCFIWKTLFNRRCVTWIAFFWTTLFEIYNIVLNTFV